MRNGIIEMIEGIGNQPQGKDRLTAMCLHALYLTQMVCRRESVWAGEVLSNQLTDVGSKFIIARTATNPVGIMFGLKSITSGAMVDEVKPGTPANELVAKCLVDLELCRAVFNFLGGNDDEVAEVEKVAEEIKSNVPLNVLEEIEANCDSAIQTANAKINGGTWV